MYTPALAFDANYTQLSLLENESTSSVTHGNIILTESSDSDKLCRLNSSRIMYTHSERNGNRGSLTKESNEEVSSGEDNSQNKGTKSENHSIKTDMQERNLLSPHIQLPTAGLIRGSSPIENSTTHAPSLILLQPNGGTSSLCINAADNHLEIETGLNSNVGIYSSAATMLPSFNHYTPGKLATFVNVSRIHGKYIQLFVCTRTSPVMEKLFNFCYF